MAREHISLALRFTVLRRDHFSCMYCGARPPYARLHVDHFIAVSNGGTNAARNLVTACEDCNLGKSDMAADIRSDEFRFEPFSRCSCPRPTCHGPETGPRDAAERNCYCRGCHACDLCSSFACDRINWPDDYFSAGDFSGCETFGRLVSLIGKVRLASTESEASAAKAELASAAAYFRDDVRQAVSSDAQHLAGLRYPAAETAQ